MASTLADVVKQCAERSIQGTLGVVTSFARDYLTRIVSLRTRLTTARTAAMRMTASSQSALILIAIQALENAVAIAETHVKTTAGALAETLRTLPEVLLAALQGVTGSLPTTPTLATVCPRVDAALRPQLTSISANVAEARLAVEKLLIDVEQKLPDLERAVVKAHA